MSNRRTSGIDGSAEQVDKHLSALHGSLMNKKVSPGEAMLRSLLTHSLSGLETLSDQETTPRQTAVRNLLRRGFSLMENLDRARRVKGWVLEVLKRVEEGGIESAENYRVEHLFKLVTSRADQYLSQEDELPFSNDELRVYLIDMAAEGIIFLSRGVSMKSKVRRVWDTDASDVFGETAKGLRGQRLERTLPKPPKGDEYDD